MYRHLKLLLLSQCFSWSFSSSYFLPFAFFLLFPSLSLSTSSSNYKGHHHHHHRSQSAPSTSFGKLPIVSSSQIPGISALPSRRTFSRSRSRNAGHPYIYFCKAQPPPTLPSRQALACHACWMSKSVCAESTGYPAISVSTASAKQDREEKFGTSPALLCTFRFRRSFFLSSFFPSTCADWGPTKAGVSYWSHPAPRIALSSCSRPDGHPGTCFTCALH